MNKLFQSLCAGLLSAALFLSLSACGQNTAAGEAETASPESASEAAADRTETVTISAEVLKKTDVDITAAARKLGLEITAVNDDGSCTVSMTDDERDTLLDALRESLDTQLAALPEEGTWPFLDGVTVSDDCRQVTLETEAGRYNAVRDNAAAQSVYLPSLLYAAFSGADTESFVQHFTVIDAGDGTVLCEFDYPAEEPEAPEEPDASETGPEESTE